jgi:hypothetical protein
MLITTRPLFQSAPGSKSMVECPTYKRQRRETSTHTISIISGAKETDSSSPWLENPFDTSVDEIDWDITCALSPLVEPYTQLPSELEILAIELQMDLELEKNWTTLQTTWQFDACHLPAIYAHQLSTVRIPSLFLFIGAISNILRTAGRITQSIHANELFSEYLTQTATNPTAIFFINHALDSNTFRIESFEGQAVVHVKCRIHNTTNVEYVELTPQNVFGVDKFVLNQSYAITKAFRDRFTIKQQLIVHVRDLVRQPESICTPATMPEAVDQGTSFDLFFPKISQPQRLARQFSPPHTTEVANMPPLGRKVYVGFMLVLIGITKTSACRPLPTWTRMTPKLLLCGGSFTNPSFPTTMILPPVSQIAHMWAIFQKMATLRRQSNTKVPIVGWTLARALSYSQEVRRYYKVSDTPDHLVKFKMLCVAWKILQIMFTDSPKLYSLMIRSFCYSAIHRTHWCCAQKTAKCTQAKDVPQTYDANRSFGMVTTCHVQEWLPKEANLVHTNDVWKWWYMCPVTTFVEDLQIPRIQLGPAFKVEPIL